MMRHAAAMISPPPGFMTSGDVAIDRRYRWAKAALDAGEPVEAADIARQAVEASPDWAPAWRLLGEALVAAGRPDAAREALKQSLALDPEDRLGACLDLARIGAIMPEDAISPGYVAALFDDYADRFDRHLLGSLAYCGPAVVIGAIRTARPQATHFAAAIDLGCGTGLMGAALLDDGGFAIDRLTGVDLSPAIIARARGREARERRVYDRLAVADITDFLASESPARTDLIVAADVLVYLGDLAPVMHAAGRALRAGGLFAFTVQALAATHESASSDFALGLDNRFAHAPDHLEAGAVQAGLHVAGLAPAVTRCDAGVPVQGYVAVMERPS